MDRDVTPSRQDEPSRDATIAPEIERERVASERQAGLSRTPWDADREPFEFAVRGSSYRLSPSDISTLHDIGRFRTVAIEDLAEHRYGGRKAIARKDLTAIEGQGLLRTKTVRASARRPPLTVVVLTKRGHDVLTDLDYFHGQTLYKGFVKPREVPHDAAIYRMFQAERERIERAGGRVLRVVLDYELKQLVYKPLATFRSQNPKAPTLEYTRLQHAVASANGLKVIDKKIPLPDLRIEYENSLGDVARVDLELATEHYHGGAMAAKARAGFHFYAADGSAGRLSRVLEERDITVAILSL
jgi:hypothetical protein